jgi:hypothetical protein
MVVQRSPRKRPPLKSFVFFATFCLSLVAGASQTRAYCEFEIGCGLRNCVRLPGQAFLACVHSCDAVADACIHAHQAALSAAAANARTSRTPAHSPLAPPRGGGPNTATTEPVTVHPESKPLAQPDSAAAINKNGVRTKDINPNQWGTSGAPVIGSPCVIACGTTAAPTAPTGPPQAPSTSGPSVAGQVQQLATYTGPAGTAVDVMKALLGLESAITPLLEGAGWAFTTVDAAAAWTEVDQYVRDHPYDLGGQVMTSAKAYIPIAAGYAAPVLAPAATWAYGDSAAPFAHISPGGISPFAPPPQAPIRHN